MCLIRTNRHLPAPAHTPGSSTPRHRLFPAPDRVIDQRKRGSSLEAPQLPVGSDTLAITVPSLLVPHS